MLNINASLVIPDQEIELHAIRAQGAGGQHVNKVSSAIHLRFDIHASSLPESIKMRLLALNDQRISQEGCIIIKAQQHRTQAKNKTDALLRLQALIRSATTLPKLRKPTRKTRSSNQRRLDKKGNRSALKAQRQHIPND